MQKMCWCLLLAVAFVALADGHSLTGLKAHRGRRAVVELTTEQKNILVDKHNELRRLAGASDMEKMRWNSGLATLAATWADQCVYENGSMEEWIGQNLFAQHDQSQLDLASAVQLWYDEVKDYHYDSKTCRERCYHYTQMVWAASRELGCAVARCAPLSNYSSTMPADYLVCYYSPALQSWRLELRDNITDHPYKKGAVCSACRSGGWCEDGLCSRDCKVGDTNCECDLKCTNGGVLNETTCSCTCKRGWTGTDCTGECKDYDERCFGWATRDCANVNSYMLQQCPLVCGQCVPECANSGVFNEETKFCDCARGWTGLDCTRECKNYHKRCTLWSKKAYCTNIHEAMLQLCPLWCGLCEQ